MRANHTIFLKFFWALALTFLLSCSFSIAQDHSSEKYYYYADGEWYFAKAKYDSALVNYN